jgi:2-dehydro-3-deoxyphosphogluconate aldolase / (4S)-4-hydroxy-2-oxoglutarate aldolase
MVTLRYDPLRSVALRQQDGRMTSLIDLAPVIPVVTLDDPADAVPMARALVAGGLTAIEISLRTPAALRAVRAVASAVPGALVGAGTVLSAGQVAAAVEAGAGFLASPGWTERLLVAMRESGLPFLPGAGTASEALGLLEHGVTQMAFFPAEAAGGPAYLRALAGPLTRARFRPTGGIDAVRAGDYLALPNVGCVGGTWLTPADALATGDYSRIEKLAAEAAALR